MTRDLCDHNDQPEHCPKCEAEFKRGQRIVAAERAVIEATKRWWRVDCARPPAGQHISVDWQNQWDVSFREVKAALRALLAAEAAERGGSDERLRSMRRAIRGMGGRKHGA